MRDWVEKTDVKASAREVPGVTEVENRLEVTPLLNRKEQPPATA